jgi:YD repeat-containing protein
MKKKIIAAVLLAGAAVYACEKQSEITKLGETSEQRNIPSDQINADIRRPSSIEKDGERTAYNFDAEGKLVSAESNSQRISVERDRTGRVAEITVTKRAVAATTDGGRIESRDRIVYSYSTGSTLPAKAVVFRTTAGKQEYQAADVQFNFNRAGYKVRETITNVDAYNLKTTANNFYYYDASNRIIKVVKQTDPDVASTYKVISFAAGYSALTLVNELALIPEYKHQKGNPSMAQYIGEGINEEFNYQYELNRQQQPVYIKETGEKGVVSEYRIQY